MTTQRSVLRQFARRMRVSLAASLVVSQFVPFLGLTPQAAHADSSPQDILFLQSNGENMRLSPGSTSGTLTNLSTGSDGNRDHAMTVSPSGLEIAFVGERLDATDTTVYPLIIMNADGSGQRPLTYRDESGTQQTVYACDNAVPSWSPSGVWIAYVCGNSIIRVSPSGSGAPETIGGGATEASPISWSPDGSRFVAEGGGCSGGYLCIVNADGSNPHAVDSSNTTSPDRAPSWSPDGTRIYFGNDDTLGIWYFTSSDSFTSSGATRHQLTSAADYTNGGSLGLYDGAATDQAVAVSADSNTLAYSTSYDSGHNAIFTVSSGGGIPTVLEPTIAGSASWPTFAKPLSPTTKNLVALGNSIAAGEGINYGYLWDGSNWVKTGPDNPAWADTTGALGDNYQDCHQTDQAFDRLFFADGYNVSNMACTGASAMNGVLASQVLPSGNLSVTVPAQLGGTCSGCDTPPSGNEFDAHAPDVVTLTLGADDIYFNTWLMKCYIDDGFPLINGHGACGTTDDDTEITNELNSARDNLRLVLTELNRRANLAGKQLTVLVTNQYNPFPSTYDSSCGDIVDQSPNSGIGLTQGEFSWMTGQLGVLNSYVGAEVSYAQTNDSSLNVRLVDISNLMHGSDDGHDHSFCSSDTGGTDPGPWAYGPSIAYTNFDLSSAPFHPTPAGQRAIYRAAKNVLQGIGAATLNPSADTYVNSTSPTSNYGSYTNLWAQSQATRALVRFDTSGAVPAGYEATGATLKLYVNHNDVTSTGTGFEVRPEGDSWTESGVNWNNQPSWSSTIYSDPGANDSAPSAGTWTTINPSQRR